MSSFFKHLPEMLNLRRPPPQKEQCEFCGGVRCFGACGTQAGFASSAADPQISAESHADPKHGMSSQFLTLCREPLGYDDSLINFTEQENMGLLDQVVGALAGGQQGGGNAQLIQTVLQLINNPQIGGLAGLLGILQKSGLGEAANSWVSTGQNRPVSAEQLHTSLGDSLIPGLAAQLGVTPQQASGSLADLLPQIIDQLTPDGRLPQDGQGDLLTEGLAMLKKGGLFG